MLADILLGTSYSTMTVAALPNVGLYGSVAPDLIISAWVLDMTLNFFVTVVIAGRLWWIGRQLASLTGTRTNRYASSIYVVVESGALAAATNIVMFALYASNSPALEAGLNVGPQLAVCVQLLFLSFAR